MQTAQIIPFKFEAREVRTLLIDEQPWFCVADICRVLGYANSRDALAKHCREKGVAKRDTLTIKGKQALTFIDEGNLYRLIIKSRKEEAQRFESWVCDEVLPAIRKHGRYEDSSNKLNTLVGQVIGTDGFHILGALVAGKVRSLPAPSRRRATMKLWAQVHAAFGVRRAEDIPADQLDSARNFIAAYGVFEGEFIEKSTSGSILSDHQLYNMSLLIHHFGCLYNIFNRHNLYEHLSGLGSRAGADMIDHFKSGSVLARKIRDDLGADFEASKRNLLYRQD